jgi:DNA adenine methylase
VIVPHPIPYQGSKRGIADQILRNIPQNVTRIVEPFAGSAAVSIAMASSGAEKTYWLNDLNRPLADLWSSIIDDPNSLADVYRKLWLAQEGRERAYYDEVRSLFNQTQKPEYLLYLLARCVKAAVRYNANGEFNQSPDNRRKGARPDTMKAHISGASCLFKDKTTVTSKDYRCVLEKVNTSDLVYMDPPYQGVCSNRDRRYIGSLDFDNFVDSLETLNRNGISYIVSYDGRTGGKKFGRALPESLKLSHVEIDAGKSSQATLLGRTEKTYESLYLSSALLKNLIVTKQL